MVGPVGISSVVSHTSGLFDCTYIMTILSLSLGVTNLLPFPPLDGGKVVLLIIEGIIKKPLNEKFEVAIQTIGFILSLSLSLFVTYNGIVKLGL
jgi:regulator of sigma E protease